jgi:peptide-methionine (S)-S-oxide reductase
VRTEVGYAGGDKVGPTYHDLGEHAEVLQVEFDPSQLSFQDLLTMFWAGHDPTRDGRRSQYRSILICEDAKQLSLATESKSEVERKLGRKVQTEVIGGKPFYPAEDYHQKWKLRRRAALYEDLAKSFDREELLLRSFAATKLNAIAGGHLNQTTVESLRHRLSLSEDGFALLSSLVR